MWRCHGRIRGANLRRVSASDRVRIYYQRLPDQEEIFNQRLVLERDDVIVTVTDPLSLPEPITVDGEPVLESGSQAVWFTFPGVWHDVGRFYRADSTFVGFYANILTPPNINTPPQTSRYHQISPSDLQISSNITLRSPNIITTKPSFSITYKIKIISIRRKTSLCFPLL